MRDLNFTLSPLCAALLLGLASAVWPLTACTLTPTRLPVMLPESHGPSVPRKAVALYKEARRLAANGDAQAAQSQFTELINTYTNTPVAAWARLASADAYFDSRRFLEAVDAYQRFVRFHPEHKAAVYSMYQIGLAHMSRMADDAWFLPPSYEKDQAAAQSAVKAWTEFLLRFDEHTLAPKARAYLAFCQSRLVAHELYVGRYYLKHAQCTAALYRARRILSQPCAPQDQARAQQLLEKAQRCAGQKQPTASKPTIKASK